MKIFCMGRRIFEAIDFIRQFKIVNGEYFINDKFAGKKVLAEGARAVCWMLIRYLPFRYIFKYYIRRRLHGLGVAPQKIRMLLA